MKFIPKRNFILLLTLCYGQGWPIGRFKLKLVFQPLCTRGKCGHRGCWWPGCVARSAVHLYGFSLLKHPGEDWEEKERVTQGEASHGQQPPQCCNSGVWRTLPQEMAKRHSRWPPAELTLLLRPRRMQLSKCWLTNSTLFLFSHPTRREKNENLAMPYSFYWRLFKLIMKKLE